MKLLIAAALLCIAIPTPAQQRGELPSDGNGLLDACRVVIQSMDNPSAVTALNSNDFAEVMKKFGWCAGYMQAMRPFLRVAPLKRARRWMRGNRGLSQTRSS